MRSVKRLCRAIEQLDNIVIENDYKADCDFSSYSLEELKAKGQELWEQSRQEDPDGYRRFNEWLNGKSLDELVKLYGKLVASDFESEIILP
ncbi:MAG: hypothetical protein BRC36_04890 [Cyanobacteria bacterium QH_2_48_84]|nr:MAG: hypothetical protein BRC36_04890 [Cyanobacteria bacterium QH_2_48_84]